MLTLPGVRHVGIAGLRTLSTLGWKSTRDLDEVAAVFDRFKDPAARHAIRHVVRAVVDWHGQIVTMADRAYLTSDNPRSEDPAAIAAEILAGVDPDRRPVVELDRRVAIRRALADASRGDVVIIAGKGHEPGQTIGGTTLPFDDREVAREELRDGRCD